MADNALWGRVQATGPCQSRSMSLKATKCAFAFSPLINLNGMAPFSAVKCPDPLYRGKETVLAEQTGGDWATGRRSASTHHQPLNCIESTVKNILALQPGFHGSICATVCTRSWFHSINLWEIQFYQLNGLCLNSQWRGETTWGNCME